MLIVAALGGNALLKRGEAQSYANQKTNIRHAARQIASVIMAGHRVVVTHGNGPQVGMLALQSEAGPAEAHAPLDLLGAESEGMIGYMIEQELRNQLPHEAKVATLLTQVVVDAADPAFTKPDKPIGPVYDGAQAGQVTAERGWQMGQDGHGWRRLVASPRPQQILQQHEIAMLLNSGVTVICAGGGGIPCSRQSDGSLAGVEAVIDKDRASALLAIGLGADFLMLLTDVDAAYVGFGTPAQRAIAQSDPGSLKAQLGEFRRGSMGPKIEAAIYFSESTGRRSVIGRLEDAAALLHGATGTIIDSQVAGIRYRA